MVGIETENGFGKNFSREAFQEGWGLATGLFFLRCRHPLPLPSSAGVGEEGGSLRLLSCLTSTKFSPGDRRRPRERRNPGNPPFLWVWPGLHLPQDRSRRFQLPPGDPGSAGLRPLGESSSFPLFLFCGLPDCPVWRVCTFFVSLATSQYEIPRLRI